MYELDNIFNDDIKWLKRIEKDIVSLLKILILKEQIIEKQNELIEELTTRESIITNGGKNEQKN